MVSLRDITTLVKAILDGKRRPAVAELLSANMLIIISVAMAGILVAFIGDVTGQLGNWTTALSNIATSGGNNIGSELANFWNSIVHFSP